MGLGANRRRLHQNRASSHPHTLAYSSSSKGPLPRAERNLGDEDRLLLTHRQTPERNVIFLVCGRILFDPGPPFAALRSLAGIPGAASSASGLSPGPPASGHRRRSRDLDCASKCLVACYANSIRRRRGGSSNDGKEGAPTDDARSELHPYASPVASSRWPSTLSTALSILTSKTSGCAVGKGLRTRRRRTFKTSSDMTRRRSEGQGPPVQIGLKAKESLDAGRRNEHIKRFWQQPRLAPYQTQ